jgi:AcrR family transcriptional regulator
MSAVMTDPPRTSRGGRPRDPSRDGVIRAAILSLLAEVGYGALTMDAVAAEAGVGKATIYRRWRTKEDLVADTIAEISRAEVTPADTGSLEGDLREMLHTVVSAVNGPMGAATQALLSTVPHNPALAAAFREGPAGVWAHAFQQIFERAEGRGELRPGLSGTVVAEAITAPIVQRWLVNGRPVTDDYADEVLAQVVMPLLRATWSPSA